MANSNKAFLFLFFALLFFGLGWSANTFFKSHFNQPKSSVLSKIKKQKTLNVVLLNSPSTYYIGVDGAQGFEYDLLDAYAKYLDVDLNITVANTVKEAIELSKNPAIHITSASLSKTEQRKELFNFGPSYFEVQEQVICNRSMIGSGRFPRTVEELSGLSIMVGEETSYSQTLESLINDGYDINATYSAEYSTEELLERVAKGEIDCTIADSNIYALNLRYFTEITMAFTISGREHLAWVLQKDAKELKTNMYIWFNEFSQSGALSQLKDHYYSYVMYFDYYNTKMFYKRITSRLPKYKHYFQEAGEKFEIPWKLLAAVSYQESHWNPKAESFTGVKGLMMLTRNTAKILGVKNRLDPKQSITGGTRHLKQMLKFIPPEVTGENRLKFALAAYNIGMGHIQDAQVLAEQMGYDKNAWSDLKKVLPLLSQKKYYRTLKFGYARGSEPIRYVESIYNYKDILDNYLSDEKEDEQEVAVSK
jgi:membrane-bound lytic murein transglycosylase F